MDITKHTIKNEKDLDYFEKYFTNSEKREFSFNEYIKNFLGCYVKVILILGNKAHFLCGKLNKIEKDFIVLSDNKIISINCVKAIYKIKSTP